MGVAYCKPHIQQSTLTDDNSHGNELRILKTRELVFAKLQIFDGQDQSHIWRVGKANSCGIPRGIGLRVAPFITPLYVVAKWKGLVFVDAQNAGSKVRFL